MEPNRVLDSRLVAQPFLGNHMEQHRSLHLHHIFDRWKEMLEIVPIDRTAVLETQFFK